MTVIVDTSALLPGLNRSDAGYPLTRHTCERLACEQVSLVDCVSFAVCRRLNVELVLAFDAHFSEQGFTLVNA